MASPFGRSPQWERRAVVTSSGSGAATRYRPDRGCCLGGPECINMGFNNGIPELPAPRIGSTLPWGDE